jgi:hypothetical protein
MELTSPSQRLLINSKSPIARVKEEFPILLTSDGILYHFTKLMGFNSHEKIVESLRNKAPKILAYFKEQATKQKFSKEIEEIEAACQELQQRTPVIPGLFVLLAQEFGEEWESLFVLNKEVGFCFVPLNE